MYVCKSPHHLANKTIYLTSAFGHIFEYVMGDYCQLCVKLMAHNFKQTQKMNIFSPWLINQHIYHIENSTETNFNVSSVEL